MAIPVILPNLPPNPAQPATEAARTDNVRRPAIPVIRAVQPYVALRQRDRQRQRNRHEESMEAWLSLHQGAVCLIGTSAAMSRRLDVIHRRYHAGEAHTGAALDIEI
ncbi:hypothetical protein MBH78_05340 [Oceanimonas sp. NS1]|uniref:Uncharacterized protein n=1 Tax=Oceanimonas doudoroffii TaxID=84158 RepID=A0A233RD89_9GAMM|nr:MULTISPECIES: hypothetical protein [Oceanimonas]MCT7654381.1 hypothetical protein [Oceanimonas sp. NS1]NHH99401.1 hypothetical protein [Oceanimonas sp. MB9]OXY81351.1 hypothetical protein B6S08_12740 [Oceanimonas doudoroffii]